MAYTHTVEIELGNGFNMEGSISFGPNAAFVNENGEEMTFVQHEAVQRFLESLSQLSTRCDGIVKVEVKPIT